MCVWVRDNASGVYYIISVLFIMSLNNVLFENERIHSVTLIFKIKARALISVQRRPSFLKSKAFIVAVMAQEVQQRHWPCHKAVCWAAAAAAAALTAERS